MDVRRNQNQFLPPDFFFWGGRGGCETLIEGCPKSFAFSGMVWVLERIFFSFYSLVENSTFF